MKKLALATVLVAILLAACSPQAGDSALADLPPTIPFEIIREEIQGGTAECLFDVQLSEIVAESDVKALGEFIKASEGKDCEKVYVYYFLPGDTPGVDVAWAYSHFRPFSDIKINGMTLESQALLKEAGVVDDPDVVGVWIDDGVSPNNVVIRKTADGYSKETTYDDGSSELIDLVVIVESGVEKLWEDPDNYFGDHMLITESGYLQFIDTDGLIFALSPEYFAGK